MNPDPNQPITPPIPPVESDVTPPAPPPAPPTPVEIPQTTSTPPPPPAPGITTDTKVKWGAGKVVGAIAVVVVLVAGLAAGIFLSQRQQNVKKSEAAGSQPRITGTGCSGDSNGISCNAPSGGSVYKFVCSGNQGSCGGSAGATPISESGPSSSEAAGLGTPCNQTVQIDAYPIPECRSAGSWVCGNTTGFAIWYSGECPTVPTVTPLPTDTPIPTIPPTSNDPSGFAGVSCEPNAQMTIRGSATDPDAANTSLQLHLYFDSDPSDNNAAVLTDTVTATNGRFSRVLPNTVARYAGTGPAVVLNDNQNHVVKAYAINAPGTAGANHELTNSPITFTFAGCAGPTATPTTPPTPTPTIPGSASCRQVAIVKIMHGGSEVANPSLAKIQKGDVVTFRGFATATNTVVTNINFVLTKSGTAQAPVSIVPTLVSGTYQADFTFTADIATTYSVSASPVYQQ